MYVYMNKFYQNPINLYSGMDQRKKIYIYLLFTMEKSYFSRSRYSTVLSESKEFINLMPLAATAYLSIYKNIPLLMSVI